jgi:hypothetical protein
VVIELDRYREAEIMLPERFALNAKARAAIKAIPGVVEVQEL